MISCGMRRLYGEHAPIKGSDGASPMANTRNVISDDVDLRVIWCKLAYLWRNPADTHRKTIVLFVFRISLRRLWVRYPIFLFFEHPVFRASRAIKNSLRSLNIHSQGSSQGLSWSFYVALKVTFPRWDLLLCSAAACACRAIESWTPMDRIKQLKRHEERENGNVG